MQDSLKKLNIKITWNEEILLMSVYIIICMYIIYTCIPRYIYPMCVICIYFYLQEDETTKPRNIGIEQSREESLAADWRHNSGYSIFLCRPTEWNFRSYPRKFTSARLMGFPCLPESCHLIYKEPRRNLSLFSLLYETSLSSTHKHVCVMTYVLRSWSYCIIILP